MIKIVLLLQFALYGFAQAENTPVQLPAQSGPIDQILATDSLKDIRDPFQMPTIINKRKENPKSDLELTQLKDIRLNGVISGPKKVRALLSVQSGKTYFVSVGDRVGVRDGRVSKIKPSSVMVREWDTDEFGKRVAEDFEIQLSGEVVSLSDQ